MGITAKRISYKYIGNPPKGYPVNKWNEQRNNLRDDIKKYAKEKGKELLCIIAEQQGEPGIANFNFDDLLI